MKKLVAGLIVVSFFFAPLPVLADYKGKVAQEIRQEIGGFYQRNEGSKITIDLMDGLMLHLNQIFEQNVIPKEVEEPLKAAPMGNK